MTTSARRGSPLVWLALVAFRLPPSSAQRATASCAAGWDWASSSTGDSPCQLATKLLSLCQSESFSLAAGGFYSPSSSGSAPIRANTCACNVVAYNLLAACQSCQESGSSVLSWSAYANACTTCSSETGISPGPCGPQSSIGFPSSVKPDEGTIAIPQWAYYNSSGDSWTIAAAKRAASGTDKVISADAPPPAATSSTASPTSNGEKSSGSPKSSKQEGSPPMSSEMKTAVIVCSALAAVVLVLFVFYLLRLYHARRRQKRLKEFSDAAFDKVIPAQKAKGPKSPKKTQFKQMMSRFTLGPRTPGLPKTPGLPPTTPKTARFFNFMLPFSPKQTSPVRDVAKGEKSAPDAVKGRALSRADEARSRTDSVASSAYSDFQDYKPPLPGPPSKASSLRSVDRQSEQISTGSVTSEQPVLRRADSTVPSIYVTDELAGSETASAAVSHSAPKRIQPARVQSHHAHVSRWSESEQSERGQVAWDRIPSMVSTASSAGRESRAVSERSSRSRKGLPPKPEADETLRFPDSRSSAASRASAENRLSDISAVSSASTVRRMQGLVNELDFGDARSPSTPRMWLSRQSTKSAKSGRTQTVPPSPSGTTIGYAM